MNLQINLPTSAPTHIFTFPQFSALGSLSCPLSTKVLFFVEDALQAAVLGHGVDLLFVLGFSLEMCAEQISKLFGLFFLISLICHFLKGLS